jgi:serine/threonine protein kinase
MPKVLSSNSKVAQWIKNVIPRSLRSQNSSVPSEKTTDRGLDTFPGRPSSHDPPGAVEHDASRLLSPAECVDQRRLSITSSFHESLHPTISPARSQHDKRHSSIVQRPAVRLPGQEQTIAPPGSTRLNASKTFCTFIVRYSESQPNRIETGQPIRIENAIVEYERDQAFDELSAIAIKYLEERHKRSAHAFYLKVGQFRLVRHEAHTNNKVASRGILEKKEDWNEYLPLKILEFLSKNRYATFHIEIEWEYSRLQIDQVPGQSYARTIATVIESKIKRNWEGRKYVPRKDLEQILTKDTISKLIREDKTLDKSGILILTGGTKLVMDDFINETWLWRTRLLGLCVYADLPLDMLYHMQRKGLEDKHIPLTKENCPAESDTRLFDRAADESGFFAAHTFAPELEHQQLPPGAVVPIIFDKNDRKHFLGQGSFGRVYKVYIDRDHHSFSAAKDEPFAFKIFYNVHAHTQMEVENESGTLATLAKVPHPNITTHLASWNQDGTCYMLFRCADCNLRTYMARKSPDWTKSNLLALIAQMRGLADGLKHIHLLGPSGLEPDRVDERREPGQDRRSQTCFHHDLKPGNILVTKNPDTEDLVFSISDFGSARIGQILSGSMEPSPFTKNLSPGDAAYGAPDAILERKTSRPYDLWSMGCIFLELLTWIVGLEEDSVQRFADRRLKNVAHVQGNQDQAFWYQNVGGRVVLKPAVIQQLEVLEERCKDRGVFPSLVRIVGKLLSILPRDRPEAAKLVTDFDAIMIQVQLDLKDEDFYIGTIRNNVRIAAPPSSVGDADDLLRRPSIDKREIRPRYGDHLLADPRANRRSTVGTMDANFGQRTPSPHTRHNSAPGAVDNPQNPAPRDVDAQVEPSSPTDERSNTPKISISDFDGSTRAEALLHTDRGDMSLPPIGSHNADFEPDLYQTMSSGSQVFDPE